MNPLDASSADLGTGTPGPALVFGNFKFASPLFALLPGLTELYRAAPFLLVFLLALLQAQWTYTGYDASAHVAEETVMARLNSAWGVFLSVAVSAVVGYVMLLALTWSIPEGKVAETAADAYPVLYIVYNNLSSFFANVIAIIIGVAMWLCGLASITSMARMWYAFARDDGMPGSSAHQAGEPEVPHAGLVHPHHQRAGRAHLHLRRGVLRGDLDQHHHAVPGLHVPDLPQLAQQAARARGNSPLLRPRPGAWASGGRCST